ncbi:hypothetical protein GGI43DRAFT_177955 [Trichoderma evansii]
MLETNSSQEKGYQMNTPVGQPSAMAVHTSSLLPGPSLCLAFARLMKYLRQEIKATPWSVQIYATLEARRQRTRSAAAGEELYCLTVPPISCACQASVRLGEAARPQVELGFSLLLTEGRGSLTRRSGIKSPSLLLSLLNYARSNQQRASNSLRGQGQLGIGTILSASLAPCCPFRHQYHSLPLLTIMCESHSQVLRLSLCFSDIWRLAKGQRKKKKTRCVRIKHEPRCFYP